MISRRAMLAGASVLGLGAFSGVVLRLHATPRRRPDLLPAHLQRLLSDDLPRPRVLFVGNSMVVRNDLPALVAAQAMADGVSLTVASASANGAYLIESVRVAGLRSVLSKNWDAVVLQDFTKVALRATNRWGSHLAIDVIARLAAPAPILLYPPFPGAPGHNVYTDAGRLTVTPSDPADFAKRTMAHYRATRHRVAPVAERWLDARENWPEFYDGDGHHPSEAGSRFIAEVLWAELKEMLPQSNASHARCFRNAGCALANAQGRA